MHLRLLPLRRRALLALPGGAAGGAAGIYAAVATSSTGVATCLLTAAEESSGACSGACFWLCWAAVFSESKEGVLTQVLPGHHAGCLS